MPTSISVSNLMAVDAACPGNNLGSRGRLPRNQSVSRPVVDSFRKLVDG